MVYLYIMINFRKVFIIRTFSLVLCALLSCQTIVFAAPISCALRIPLGFDTNKRLSKTMLIDLLINHFKTVSMDSQDMKIMQSLSDEIQEEDTWKKFITDEEFRNDVLFAIIIELPKDVQELWDISDTLSLSERDIAWFIDKVYEGLNQSSISLPGIPEKIEAKLSKYFIANNVKKLGLGSSIDKQLKSLIRDKLPKDLISSVEWKIRLIGSDAKNTSFLITLLKEKDCFGDIFKPALSLLLYLYQSEKKSKIEEMLKARRKHEFEIIFQNQRFDEMPDIVSAMATKEIIKQVEELKPMRLEIPIMQTGDGSYPYLSGRIAVQKAQQNIQLLDYLLGLDEETVPSVLNKVAFDINSSLSPKSERIRAIRDYREMYLKIYPVDQNEEELIRMSLAVLKKLYLLLNEYVRLLKELKSKMKERGDIFQEIIITPRLDYISKMKSSMLEAFKKTEKLYEDKDYEGARQKALALYKTELYKKLFSNSYPTVITVDFIDLLKEEANDHDIQDILKRLNEIDFGSCRLIEFITTALSEKYSVLRYPYIYDFDNIFLFGKTENPWENLGQHFKEKENVDISGIERISKSNPRAVNLIAFGEIIEIMLYELLKNAITNARFDPKARKLKGEIQENFEDTPDGYCYTMEDNNAGIPMDRLRSIFNICVSYTRFDPNKPRYKEFAGLGIGLAKVLAIVDMYGGTLRVISRVDGKEAYELTYEKGNFSSVTLSEKNDELQYPTGTKFFITFPYSAIDLDQVLPGKNRRANGYLPLVTNNKKKVNRLTSNQVPRGPFRIRGTDILCYADEVSGRDKIKEILQKWFSGNADRDFAIEQWEVLMRNYPDGYLAKLETEAGKVLGLAFVRKIHNFMFSINKRAGEENIGPVYFLDQMEIIKEYRDLGLGEILMAKVVEKALNDADIKDKILMTEPATRGQKSSDNFFNKIGGIPMNIIEEDLLDDETEWQTRHYVFHRATCESILDKARSHIAPVQLNLFENMTEAANASL